MEKDQKGKKMPNAALAYFRPAGSKSLAQKLIEEAGASIDKDKVAEELRLLREEIASLRDMLVPRHSPILTGPSVIEESKKLTALRA